jgi:hypothetical protein
MTIFNRILGFRLRCASSFATATEDRTTDGPLGMTKGNLHDEICETEKQATSQGNPHLAGLELNIFGIPAHSFLSRWLVIVLQVEAEGVVSQVDNDIIKRRLADVRGKQVLHLCRGAKKITA